MNHIEAVEQLAVEQYLLGELTPADHEAFEVHLFDCPECAVDLRAGRLFLEEAKAELPNIHDKPIVQNKTSKSDRTPWFSWLRPAFVAPAFAALLAVVIFQNTVTFPALREAATEPRLVPLSSLHPATRGASHPTLIADRVHGASLQLDFAEPGAIATQSYSIELRDAQGKLVWTTTMPAGNIASDQDRQFSLYLPGAKLNNGSYSLKITSVDAQGQSTPIEEYLFDIVVNG